MDDRDRITSMEEMRLTQALRLLASATSDP